MNETKLYGLDVSDLVTPDQWQCLVTQRNAQFAVVRCYRNADNGIPDTNCLPTVLAGWNAGLKFVDLYHFPVIRDKSAQEQVDEDLGFLFDNHVRFGRLWLDVEGSTGGDTWYPDVSENVAFIQDFVTAVQDRGVTAGIYCGTSGWDDITGNTEQFKDLPLWWSSHGATFSSFGGWTTPFMVQYAYATAHCDVSYDSDYCEI